MEPVTPGTSFCATGPPSWHHNDSGYASEDSDSLPFVPLDSDNPHSETGQFDRGRGVIGLQTLSTLKGHKSWLSELSAPFMIHSTTAGALTAYLSRSLSETSIIVMKLALSIQPLTIVTINPRMLDIKSFAISLQLFTNLHLFPFLQCLFFYVYCFGEP